MKQLFRKPEHFDQIIEMAVNLFPEYKKFKWGKNWDHDEVWFYDEKDNSYEIHWFEFSVNWLSSKLGYSPATLFRKLEEECTGEHIVDLLYKTYKNVR